MCPLSNLCSLLLCGKCLSISFKNSCAMLVFTFLLKGGLYHITFRCRLLRVLVLVFGCSCFSCALKLLRAKASLYVGAASSKVSLSQHRVLIRRLMEWGSSRMIGGGMVGRLVNVEWVVVRFSVRFVGAIIQVKGQVQEVRAKLIIQCSYFQPEVVKHSDEFFSFLIAKSARSGVNHCQAVIAVQSNVFSEAVL